MRPFFSIVAIGRKILEINSPVKGLKTHYDCSVHKLLESRDAPIKSLVATVSFTVEPQKLMRGMLPDFLAVRGASTASKRLLLDAKDHLRASTVYKVEKTLKMKKALGMALAKKVMKQEM